MFSTQALTNDKVYLLVLYMGDGGGGDQTISIHMKVYTIISIIIR